MGGKVRKVDEKGGGGVESGKGGRFVSFSSQGRFGQNVGCWPSILQRSRLVKLLENVFETSKKKWVLSKNGLRIALGR